MGLFFYTKKGSIISTVDLPTTEIIEPEKFIALFMLKKERNPLFIEKLLNQLTTVNPKIAVCNDRKWSTD